MLRLLFFAFVFVLQVPAKILHDPQWLHVMLTLWINSAIYQTGKIYFLLPSLYMSQKFYQTGWNLTRLVQVVRHILWLLSNDSSDCVRKQMFEIMILAHYFGHRWRLLIYIPYFSKINDCALRQLLSVNMYTYKILALWYIKVLILIYAFLC